MFDMIAFHIFDWGSLKTMATALLPEKARQSVALGQLKVTRVDSVTVVVVAIVSIFTNLAVGVGAGVVVCSLAFAWSHGKEIKLQDRSGADITESKIGKLQTMKFADLSKKEQDAVVDLGLKDEWDNEDHVWDEWSEWPLGQHSTVEAQEKAGGTVSEEVKKKVTAAQELGFNINNWQQLAPKKYVRTEMHVVGTLFFGSARVFSLLFTRPLLRACPKHIDLSFVKGEVTDFSAVVSFKSSTIAYSPRHVRTLSFYLCVLMCAVATTILCVALQQAALQNLAEMFKKEGSELHLLELSRDSHRLMDKSKALLEDVSTLKLEEIVLSPEVASMVTNYTPNRPHEDSFTKDRQA